MYEANLAVELLKVNRMIAACLGVVCSAFSLLDSDTDIEYRESCEGGKKTFGSVTIYDVTHASLNSKPRCKVQAASRIPEKAMGCPLCSRSPIGLVRRKGRVFRSSLWLTRFRYSLKLC